MNIAVQVDDRLRQGVETILTGLNGRENLIKEDVDALRRELRLLASETQARITSEEQLNAERIVAYMFRPSVEECLKLWFGKSELTDVDIWQRFGDDVQLATDGEFDHWALNPRHPRMFLALILLLDQFRRNMFRESPEMYAADYRCLSLVRRAITRGVVDKLQLIERIFPCLVLTHSEEIADQHLCMEEWSKVESELTPTDPLRVFHEVFRRHVEVIEKFGRFPHRNALLGRASTAEEETFLANADFRFDLPLVKGADGKFSFQGDVSGCRAGMAENVPAGLSYQGPDAAMAQAEEQIRLQGYAQIGNVKLRKFIVEREIPKVASKSHKEMSAKVDSVNKAMRALWPRISWVESFMCNDKMYCVYLADSAATLHKHALLADVPLTSAREVRRIVDSGTFEDPQ
jgi:uncharacterized protein (DUF924 family)